MKINNKGLGRIELMTVIVLLLVVFCFIAYVFLQGTSGQKMETMKENALNFSKAVVGNISSFRKVEIVYLDEAIDQSVSKQIKSPLGGKYCDGAFTKVESEDGKAYVTMQCGKYLIKRATFKTDEEVPIYEISDWTETKPKASKDVEIEEATLYNCEENGKLKYDRYYEKDYLVFITNKDFESDGYFVENIYQCDVKSKTFYRTLKKVEQKKK